MSNLAGMNLALSRLDSPKLPPIDIDTFYIDTVDGIKTVAFLQEFYNKWVEKQKDQNKQLETTKKPKKTNTVAKNEQNSEQPKNGKSSENSSKKSKRSTQ